MTKYTSLGCHHEGAKKIREFANASGMNVAELLATMADQLPSLAEATKAASPAKNILQAHNQLQDQLLTSLRKERERMEESMRSTLRTHRAQTEEIVRAMIRHSILSSS